MGAPRVHIEGAGQSGVELREIIGWEVRPYNRQTPGVVVVGERADPISRRACAAPCLDIIDGRRGQEFFFGGPGLSDSEVFTLSQDSGTVRYQVSPGNARSKQWGMPLAGLGASGFLVGGVVALIGAAGARDYSGTGGVMMAVSGAMLVSGVALLLNGRTTFTRVDDAR